VLVGSTASTGFVFSGLVGKASFVSTNPNSPDLHLSSGDTTAADKGETTYCPATDIDGQQRPRGAACDIGGDER
jgi:hypothetical protein